MAQFAVVTRFLNKQYKMVENVYLMEDGTTRRQANKFLEKTIESIPLAEQGSFIGGVHVVSVVKPDGTRRT